MEYRRVGRTGLEVSPFCLGTMFFGDKAPEDECIRMIHRVFDSGVNFFDTANVYGCGKAETILGKALKGKRHQAVVVTKVYGGMGKGPNQSGLGRHQIITQAESSLKRLQTDYIDIYLAHMFDHSVPLDETLGAFNDLLHQGKVRYIGCSNHAAFQIATAHRISDRFNWARYQCVQNRYTLIARQTELEVLPYCQQEGMGMMAYAPLGAGFLTGKYGPDREPPDGSRYSGSSQWSLVATEANFKILELLEEIAKSNGRTISQIALAWVLGHPAVTTAVVGATSVEQLEENLGVLDYRINDEERERLNVASKHNLGVYRYHSGGGAHILQPMS